MPGVSYTLGLENEAFKQGAAQSMDYINQLHGRIDKLKGAGAGGNGFLAGLSKTLFQLPQQVMALQGIMSTLALPSKLAASAETTAVAFRVLVGDAAKADAVLGKVRKMADSTPFEFAELADSSRKLIAFGEAADDIPETLRRIGDISAGISAPISEIAELYGKARVQGTLFAEDINQLTGRGVPIIEAFAKQLGVTTGEIKALASQGAITFPMLEKAFAELSSGSGKFAGMMERVSQTFEGRMSTLKDSFSGLMSAMGEGINEALKPLLTGASEKIDSMKEKARELGKAIGEAVDYSVTAVQTGKGGEMMLEAMRSGGLIIADHMVRAADLVGTRIAASMALAMAKANPAVSKDELAVYELGKALASQLTMDSPGVGNADLKKSANDSSAAFQKNLMELNNEVAARRRSREEEAKAYDHFRDQIKNSAKLGDAMSGAVEAVINKVAEMNGKTVYDPNAGMNFKPLGTGGSGGGGGGAGSGTIGGFTAPGIGPGQLRPIQQTPEEEREAMLQKQRDRYYPKPAKDGDTDLEKAARPFDSLPAPDMSGGTGRRTIKGAGFGKKDKPRQGLSYFDGQGMADISTPNLDAYAERRKIKGVGSVPAPADLEGVSGRGDAKQRAMDQRAGEQGSKAAQSDKAAAIEQLIRKMASDLETLAKAAAAEAP